MFLSFPAGTKMFQFPASAQLALCAAFNRAGSPIRTSPDQFLFADPRSFSQLTTSFIAFGSQGILRSLLFSFSYLCESGHRISLFATCLVFASEIVVPNITNEKTRFKILQTLISLLLFYLVISLNKSMNYHINKGKQSPSKRAKQDCS